MENMNIDMEDSARCAPLTCRRVIHCPSRQKFEKTRLKTQNYTFLSVFRRPKKTERLNAYSSRFSSMSTVTFSVHTFHRRLYASEVSFLIV